MKNSKWNIVSNVFKLINNWTKLLSVMVITIIIEGFLPALQVTILGLLVGSVVSQEHQSMMVFLSMYLLTFAVQPLTNYFKDKVYLKIKLDFSIIFEELALKKVNMTSLMVRFNAYFADSFTAVQNALQPGQISQLFQRLVDCIVIFAASVILIVNLFRVNALVPIIVFLIFIILFPFQKKMNQKYTELLFMRTREQNRVASLEHSIFSKAALIEMSVSGHFPWIQKIWRTKYRSYIRKKLMDSLKIMSWIHLTNGLWKLCPVLLSFILLLATSTSVVETIIFFGSLSALLPKLSLFIEKFAQVQDSLITYNKVLTFLNTEYPQNKHSQFAPSNTSKIDIQDVTFTYPNSDYAVISNVNLNLKKGQIICIVGKNGSGKSTLVHLILGLYEPSQGSITYDEQCIFPRSSVFFQNFLKLESSIRDNVSFGNPKEDTDEYIVQKLKDANADFAIEAGLDCSLDPQFGGRNLSGGQWQRLALARTFLQQNGIIVLDEPTASLDPVAEIELYTTVLEKYKDRTILFVSHRLTASILADQIWVMDEGRLVETGTHNELVKQKGEYNKLFTAQAQPYLEYYQKTTIGG